MINSLQRGISTQQEILQLIERVQPRSPSRLSQILFRTSPETLGRAVKILQHIRSISIPILTDDFRRELLDEAKQYPLRSARNTVGKGANRVHQDMLLQDQLTEQSLFNELVVEFQKLFDEAVDSLGLFSSKVVFNDVMIQMYAPGSGGITPHRDRTDYRHIICLFVLEGYGRFYISGDRNKTNQLEITNLPGDVLLMPGPGFAGLEERPFHYLEDISEERWIFGLRHDESKLN